MAFRLVCVITLFIISLPNALCGEWELVWQDEFEEDGLPDPEKWNYDTGYIANNEKQYYTKARRENARVENGALIIEARKEAREGFDYTSARLVTRGRQTWTYGRFEIRAKLPTGRGTWPAIWMLGANIREVGWPECGEIDIMENVGFDPDRIHANIHTEAYNHTKNTQKGDGIEAEAPYESFNLYAIEWSAERIDFFFNETKYFTYENDGRGDWTTWPFGKPHYLILNLAVGGNWGGREGIDDSIFPQRFLVDYVRVYQKTGE